MKNVFSSRTVISAGRKSFCRVAENPSTPGPGRTARTYEPSLAVTAEESGVGTDFSRLAAGFGGSGLYVTLMPASGLPVARFVTRPLTRTPPGSSASPWIGPSPGVSGKTGVPIR